MRKYQKVGRWPHLWALIMLAIYAAFFGLVFLGLFIGARQAGAGAVQP